MKKISTFFAALVICLSVFAKPVDVNDALVVARNFWSQHSDRPFPEMVDVAELYGLTEMYLFASVADDGFVIVAKDDIAKPILGYSTDNGIQARTLPENLLGWLNHYSGEIASARNAGYEGSEFSDAEWNNLRNNTYAAANGRKAVEPLVKTFWDQGSPYNNMCPYDVSYGYNVRSVTGCAATAMAQVLRYWKWPIKGTGTKTYTCTSLSENAPERTLTADFGSTTYQWEFMPEGKADYTWNNVQKNAVATLMYHCGVSLEMGYTSNLSSAYTSAYPTALKSYFSYNNAASVKYKSSYSEANWKSMLKAELDARHPLLYRGSSEDQTGGHAFVCDGYDGDDNFHFNWGWSELGDAYFPLSSLTPTQVGTGAGLGDYSYYQGAVFNVTPSIQTANSFTLPSSVAYGATLSGSCGFRNTGATVFNGYLGVAAYNSNDEFVNIIAQSDLLTFNGNSSKTVTINYTVASPMSTGDYTAKAVCSIDGTTWYVITVGYNGCATEMPFTVTGQAPDPVGDPDMKVYQSFALGNDTYVMGNTLTGTCGFKNVGDGPFSGKVGVAAYTSSGSLVTVLKQASASLAPDASTTLSINYSIASPLAVGTYVARPVYSTDNGATWTIINTSSDGSPTLNVFTITQAGSGNSDLKVSNNFSITPSTINVGGAVIGSCNLRNTGDAAFNGMVGVAAYNATNTIVDILAEQEASVSANALVAIPISYTLSSTFAVGNYVARPVYSTDGGANWTPVSMSVDETPAMVVFSVIEPVPTVANLKVCNGFAFTSTSVVIGDNMIGTCGLRNTGDAAFDGMVGVAAYSTTGSLVALMEQQNAVINIDGQRTISINFDVTSAISAGTYVARAVYSYDEGETWSPVTMSSDNTPSQIIFTVSNPPGSAELRVESLTLDETTVELGSTLSGRCAIKNTGDETFSGKIGVAAYNGSGNLLYVIVQQSTYMTPDAVRSPSFDYVVAEPFSVGSYTARAVYSTDNGASWTPINLAVDQNPTSVDFSVIEHQGGDQGDDQGDELGIEMASTGTISVKATDHSIIVSGAAGLDITVVDVLGRVVSRTACKSDSVVIPVGRHGIYLVKAANYPAAKVMVR